MTDSEFDALLARRDDLRRQHEEWCREINTGGCRLSETSREARLRDGAYWELCQVQDQIDAAIEAERLREEA